MLNIQSVRNVCQTFGVHEEGRGLRQFSNHEALCFSDDKISCIWAALHLNKDEDQPQRAPHGTHFAWLEDPSVRSQSSNVENLFGFLHVGDSALQDDRGSIPSCCNVYFATWMLKRSRKSSPIARSKNLRTIAIKHMCLERFSVVSWWKMSTVSTIRRSLGSRENCSFRFHKRIS